MWCGREGWVVMGIEEGTFWDEHWVLYGNQLDNKFHIKIQILKFLHSIGYVGIPNKRMKCVRIPFKKILHEC